MLGVITTILTVILVFICLLMSLVILMQRPKQEGLGAAFGGGIADKMLGSGTTDFLQRATVMMGVAFFVLSLTIATLMAYDRDADRKAGVGAVKEAAAAAGDTAGAGGDTAGAGGDTAGAGGDTAGAGGDTAGAGGDTVTSEPPTLEVAPPVAVEPVPAEVEGAAPEEAEIEVPPADNSAETETVAPEDK